MKLVCDTRKIYGANIYGNDKLSNDNKLKWFIKHEKYILNLDDNFINSSKNYYLFKAFCFNYKNFYNNNEYIINSFICLDATCSGAYQQAH